MIDFRISVDLSDLEEGFADMAQSLEDPTRPLVRVGGRIIHRADRIIRGEGMGRWPGLAESTIKRKLTAAQVDILQNPGRGKPGERSIVQRVVRDAAGTEKWAAKAAALRQQIQAKQATGKSTRGLEAREGKALAQAKLRIDKIRKYRHVAIAAGIEPQRLVAFARKEVARAKAHGKILRAVKKLERAGVVLTERERRKMTRQHARRYTASERSTRMLGGLEGTFHQRVVERTRVEIFSHSKISKIHNEGGTAGHGAKIKARPFLWIDASDTADLGEYLVEAAVDAYAGE